MHALQIEVRTDARVGQWRASKCLAHIPTVRREIAEAPGVGLVANGAVALAAVDDFHRQDIAEANELIVHVMLVVEHVKLVARLNIQDEVDVPLEDVGDAVRERVGQASALTGVVQRAFDDSVCVRAYPLRFDKHFLPLEASPGTFELQRLQAPKTISEPQQIAVFVALELELMARIDARQSFAERPAIYQQVQIHGANAVALENVGQIVAGLHSGEYLADVGRLLCRCDSVGATSAFGQRHRQCRNLCRCLHACRIRLLFRRPSGPPNGKHGNRQHGDH